MVSGEFVLEGRLKDIAAKAVVLAVEAVCKASCCGWGMAIPAPRAARGPYPRGSGPLATPCTVPRGSHRIELEDASVPGSSGQNGASGRGETDAPEEYKVSNPPKK